MIKRIVFTLLSFCLAIHAFATTPVRLLSQENWKLSENKQFAYAISIDTARIILQLEILSPHLMMQSQTSGLKAYIDLTGKKKEKYSVAFPVLQGFVEGFMKDKMPQNMGIPPQGEGGEPPAQGRMPQTDTIQTMPETVTPLKLGGSFASFFVDKDESILSAEDVTVSYVDGRMFYTCSLPVSLFGTKRNKKGIYHISIALQEKDLAQIMESLGNPPSDFPQGGMGGPGGMGRPRPRDGGGFPGARHSEMKKQNRQWIEFSENN